MLKDLNVDWLPLTAQQFAEIWLARLGPSVSAGFKTIARNQVDQERDGTPSLVSDISIEPGGEPSQYLLGHQPGWSDLQSGRAILRECDESIFQAARAALEPHHHHHAPLVVSGTAGSGKSTALMRLGLRLSGMGIPVYWIDETTNLKPYKLRQLVLDESGPLAVLVDDGDLWGRILTSWATEIPKCKPGTLFGVALRSSRIDGLVDSTSLGGIQPVEINIPNLTDKDVEELVAVLDRENRLGILKGLSHVKRIAAFKKEAGRQLLVAMIQATSGRKFTEKVYEEYHELDRTQKLLYGTVCLISSQRYTVDRNELLLAVGGADNETLNSLEVLCRRHLISRRSIHSGYSARHRVIAEELIHHTEFRQWIGVILEGVLFALATTTDPDLPKSDKRWRRLIRFMNHDYLMRALDVGGAREVYQRIESLLNWDYHYWLQRGSLEVEIGDLSLARNFLDQARSLASGDRLVENEYAYLQMKRAASSPHSPAAQDMFRQGYNTLEELIGVYGKQSPYHFHVLGSQALAWTRRATLPVSERSRVLSRTLAHVQKGAELHQNSEELRQLRDAVHREWLSIAVGN